MNKVISFSILTIIFSFSQFSWAQSESKKWDTLMYYTNGMDSLRIIKYPSGKRIEFTYYPSGGKKSEHIFGKSKARKTCKEYTKWKKGGSILEKTKTCRIRKNGSYKDIKLILWENGKRCRKKEETGWSDKY